jgi:hypothetical protein
MLLNSDMKILTINNNDKFNNTNNVFKKMTKIATITIPNNNNDEYNNINNNNNNNNDNKNYGLPQ